MDVLTCSLPGPVGAGLTWQHGIGGPGSLLARHIHQAGFGANKVTNAQLCQQGTVRNNHLTTPCNVLGGQSTLHCIAMHWP